MWVLIINLVTWDGVTMTTQEYTSASRCTAAANGWKQQMTKLPRLVAATATCSEK